MTHDELKALIAKAYNAELGAKLEASLLAVVELCATQDEVTIGDKGLFNSGRNSMRDEIKQAIKKELG